MPRRQSTAHTVRISKNRKKKSNKTIGTSSWLILSLTQQTTLTLNIEYFKKHEISVRSRRYRLIILFGMARTSLLLAELTQFRHGQVLWVQPYACIIFIVCAKFFFFFWNTLFFCVCFFNWATEAENDAKKWEWMFLKNVTVECGDLCYFEN